MAGDVDGPLALLVWPPWGWLLAGVLGALWGSFFIWKGLRVLEFAGLSNFARLFVFPSGERLYGALWHNTIWFFGIMPNAT